MIALCFKDTAFSPRQSKNISASDRKETRIKVKIKEFYYSVWCNECKSSLSICSTTSRWIPVVKVKFYAL